MNDGIAGNIMESIPDDIMQSYASALKDTVPDRSYKRYVNAYNVFIEWQKTKETSSFAEPLLMAYFNELSIKCMPSTLWSTYSMIKSMLKSHNNIDISGYNQLNAFLKKKSDGFVSKKSEVFSAEEVQKFLLEAPDDRYLAMKTVLIFGVTGACRGVELTNIKVQNVRQYGKEIIVSIPDTKTKVSKSYPINGEFAEIVRKYIQLRPGNDATDRFFLQYRNGKCLTQVIGKNSIANMPREIAKFLQLPDFASYTGHSLRRTSTTILADAGAAIEIIKRHGQWKSNTVAEGYVQESLGHKRKIGSLISTAVNLPSSSNANLLSSNIVNDGLESSSRTIKRTVTSTITTSDFSIKSSQLSIVTSQAKPMSTSTLPNGGPSQQHENMSVSQLSVVESQQKAAITSQRDGNVTLPTNGNPVFNFKNCNNLTIRFCK